MGALAGLLVRALAPLGSGRSVTRHGGQPRLLPACGVGHRGRRVEPRRGRLHALDLLRRQTGAGITSSGHVRPRVVRGGRALRVGAPVGCPPPGSAPRPLGRWLDRARLKGHWHRARWIQGPRWSRQPAASRRARRRRYDSRPRRPGCGHWTHALTPPGDRWSARLRTSRPVRCRAGRLRLRRPVSLSVASIRLPHTVEESGELAEVSLLVSLHHLAEAAPPELRAAARGSLSDRRRRATPVVRRQRWRNQRPRPGHAAIGARHRHLASSPRGRAGPREDRACRPPCSCGRRNRKPCHFPANGRVTQQQHADRRAHGFRYSRGPWPICSRSCQGT